MWLVPVHVPWCWRSDLPKPQYEYAIPLAYQQLQCFRAYTTEFKIRVIGISDPSDSSDPVSAMESILASWTWPHETLSNSGPI